MSELYLRSENPTLLDVVSPDAQEGSPGMAVEM